MNTTAAFLDEGAKSYVDALAAIRAFENAVFHVCRDVYDKYSPQLIDKMGLINGQCEDFKNLEPENRFAELGVRQDSPSRRETLEIYLMWDEAEDGMPRVSACVSLGFTTKADRNDYAKLLRTIRSIQSGDDPWPYLWTSKKLIDLSSSAEIFGALVSEWLDRWPAGRTFK